MPITFVEDFKLESLNEGEVNLNSDSIFDHPKHRVSHQSNLRSHFMTQNIVNYEFQKKTDDILSPKIRKLEARNSKSVMYSPIKVAMAGSTGGGFSNHQPEPTKKIEVEFFSIRNIPKYPNFEIRNSKLMGSQRKVFKKKLLDIKMIKRKSIKNKKVEKQSSMVSNNNSNLEPIYA